MTITDDPENGENHHRAEITRPLILKEKTSASTDQSEKTNNGSICVVLLATLVSVSGSFIFGSCAGFSAPTQSGIRADLGLSLSEYSLFGSIITIGAMVGAATSGRVADYIGRKGAMRVSAVFCIVGWLAIYFGNDVWPLDLGRLCGGYGIGVLSYVVPVYIAEIAPKNLRGGLTTVNQLMICTGASFAFILGTVLEWRMLALTGLIPCFLLLLGLFFIPESPRWLAKVGQEVEFEAALQKLRGKDADIYEEATEIKDYIETLQSLPKAQFQDLFQRKYTHSLIVGVGLMVCQQLGGINGISFYLTEMLVSAGFSSGNIGTIAWATIQIPITTVAAVSLDKFGRRPLLMISATGTFMGLFLVGIAFFLKSYGLLMECVPILVLTGTLVYIASFSMGMGGVPWLIMSEIFPINMKGVAGSLVTVVNWFTSWVVSYAFNDLMRWSSTGTFFLFSLVCAMTVLFVKKLVPETKGRTLEQIQASMNSFSKEIC